MTGASRKTTRSLLKQKQVRMARPAARPEMSTRSRSSSRWSQMGMLRSSGSSSSGGRMNFCMADGSAAVCSGAGGLGCTSGGTRLPGIGLPACMPDPSTCQRQSRANPKGCVREEPKPSSRYRLTMTSEVTTEVPHPRQLYHRSDWMHCTSDAVIFACTAWLVDGRIAL